METPRVAFPAEGISRRVSPTVEESVLRTRHADRTPLDAFPAAPRVASLAMVHCSKAKSVKNRSAI